MDKRAFLFKAKEKDTLKGVDKFNKIDRNKLPEGYDRFLERSREMQVNTHPDKGKVDSAISLSDGNILSRVRNRSEIRDGKKAQKRINTDMKNRAKNTSDPYQSLIHTGWREDELSKAAADDNKVGKDGKIKAIEDALDCEIAKKVATMMATSHEYKKPNVDGALALVKNYDWEESTEKVKNLQGIHKPVKKDKALDIAFGIKKDKGKVSPFIVVNQIHGIRPQTSGKKILLDGHHRKEACELLDKEEVPIYKGTYNGKSQKKKSELREKTAALKPGIDLYSHQERVVNKPGDSVIAAHSVGSGKTLSGIARFEKLKEEGKANKALVVVPAGLRENFGVEGVGKFTDSKYNIVGNKGEVKKGEKKGPDKDSDYNIISYEMFRKNPDKYLEETGADTIITDESHRGKNEGTITTESLKSVKDKYKNYIGLTGSVVSNRIADVQPLVDVASKGNHILGDSKDEFEDKWIKRNNRGPYKHLHKKRQPIVGFKNRKKLKEELGKYIDYVDYDDIKDVANMPDKNLSVNKVPMTKDQAKKYKKIIKEDKSMMDMIKKKRLETMRDEEASKAFSKLVETRKLMNDVGSANPNSDIRKTVEETPKTKTLLDDLDKHLKETDDGQALLFSHLITGGTDALEAGLKNRGIEYGKFLGKGNKGITEESRQKDVDDFNKRKRRAMIVSSAGGEGLSLNDTTWEGVLDPHYNPEKMKQMEARGIRSGGLSHRAPEDRTVEVNRYISTMPKTLGLFKSRYRTPDEIIYEIAKNKNTQNEKLFDLLKEGRGEGMDKVAMYKEEIYKEAKLVGAGKRLANNLTGKTSRDAMRNMADSVTKKSGRINENLLSKVKGMTPKHADKIRNMGTPSGVDSVRLDRVNLDQMFDAPTRANIAYGDLQRAERSVRNTRFGAGAVAGAGLTGAGIRRSMKNKKEPK